MVIGDFISLLMEDYGVSESEAYKMVDDIIERENFERSDFYGEE